MRLLVNIRGTNGSGKSTIPMSMLDDTKQRVIDIRGDKKSPRITVFPSYRWVALGTYYNKTGGMDTIANNVDTYDALMYALENYPDYDILMEGIIASTIKSTYANLFHEIEDKADKGELEPTKIIVMSFLPPVEVCIQRVLERNGGQPVKADQIENKWRTVDRNVSYFKEQGFISLRVNNEMCPKDRMLKNFLRVCNKYRGD